MNDLLQCARIAFRYQHGLAVDAPCKSPEPTDGLLRQASQHRLVGLFAAELFPVWMSRAYGQALYTTRCAAMAESVYTQLRKTIPSVALIKGPALALQAWSQPGLRSYDDLDFRCAFVDYNALLDAMATLGYKPGLGENARNAHLWHFGWGVAFVHPEGPIVECNHRMFPPHYPWPIKLSGMSDSHWQMQVLDEVALKMPVPALHLLYCCMHALWHGWERLAWLADIAGLLVRHPDAYSSARKLASQHRFAQHALQVGCALAEHIFGSLSVPGGICGVSPQLLAASVARLQQPPQGSYFARQRRFHYRFMRGPERLQYDCKRLLIPGDADFRCWPLPPALASAYWVLRPLRLPARLWAAWRGVSRMRHRHKETAV